jgi:hypothetical protein
MRAVIIDILIAWLAINALAIGFLIWRGARMQRLKRRPQGFGGLAR